MRSSDSTGVGRNSRTASSKRSSTKLNVAAQPAMTVATSVCCCWAADWGQVDMSSPIMGSISGHSQLACAASKVPVTTAADAARANRTPSVEPAQPCSRSPRRCASVADRSWSSARPVERGAIGDHGFLPRGTALARTDPCRSGPHAHMRTIRLGSLNPSRHSSHSGERASASRLIVPIPRR